MSEPIHQAYKACYCVECGIECHAISGAYLEKQLCPKCYEKEQQKQPLANEPADNDFV